METAHSRPMPSIIARMGHAWEQNVFQIGRKHLFVVTLEASSARGALLLIDSATGAFCCKVLLHFRREDATVELWGLNWRT